MKQLDLLWQYQELETLMDGYRQEKNSLPMRKDLGELKKYLLEQQSELIKLDDEANKKSNTLNKIYHEYDNIINILRIDREKIEKGNIRNLKQVEQLEKDAQALKEKTTQKEAELKTLVDELEEFREILKEIGLRITKAKREYKKVKLEYDGQAGEIKKKYNSVKNKHDKLKQGIDGSLLSKYNSLKSNYDDPISMVTDNYCCSGCNMQIAALAVQHLKEDNHIIECENCGRILYRPEEETQVS